MFKAREAREIAKLYVEPKINIEDIMNIIYREIFNAARSGKYKMKMTVDPKFVREAKELLKGLGYTVAVFHSSRFDYREGLVDGAFTGDIEIVWN